MKSIRKYGSIHFLLRKKHSPQTGEENSCFFDSIIFVMQHYVLMVTKVILKFLGRSFFPSVVSVLRVLRAKCIEPSVLIKNNSSQPGYILVFALLFMTILVLLMNQLYNKSVVHAKFVQTMIEREKAKMLAFGGIQMAMSYLSDKDLSITTTAQQKKPKTADEKAKTFLEKIMPVLNRWQIIELQEKTESIEGTIKLCIMCEDGKININNLYDFEEHKFINEGKAGDGKKILQTIFTNIKSFVGDRNLFEEFEKFLKQRHYKLNDVTELVTIKDFELFKDLMFYEPPEQQQKKQKETQEQKKVAAVAVKKKPVIYLTDIFSVWPEKATIEPWLLSDSLCALLQLKRAQQGGLEQREKESREWLKNFKVTAKWQEDWNKQLLPMYGKDFSSIPKEITAMFSATFEPKIFSVLCYGTVGHMTQKLFVILQRSASDDKKGESGVRIKKLYWL